MIMSRCCADEFDMGVRTGVTIVIGSRCSFIRVVLD